MEDTNNFKYYQERISKSNKTFKSDGKVATNVFTKGVKQYVDAFGSSQNEFNNDVAMAFEELQDFSEKINILETKMASLVQQNEALKTRINALQRTDLMIVDSCIKSISDNTRLIDGYVRQINPELRNGYVPNGCRDVDFQTLVQAVQIPQDSNDSNFDYVSFSKTYRDTLKKELQKVAVDGAERIIAVVCKGFLNPNGVDDATYEAVQIYKLLKKSSVYSVKFISIEPKLERPVLDGDFLCIPANGCGQYIQVIEPKATVFCTSTLDIFSMDSSLATHKGIVVLTGQDPIGDTSTELLEELIYANDFGIHSYLVQSQGASRVLVDRGFHEPKVSYPIVNASKVPSVRKKPFDAKDFTVGVVSTLTPDDNSGMSLLADVVKSKPEYSFNVVWNSNVEVPSELSNADNCTIVKATNLEEFYSTIDCLLVPYVTTVNGACPVSALEVMLLDIPVVCTDVSGVAELVTSFKLGEVSSADSVELSNAIDRVSSNYGNYMTTLKYQNFKEALDYTGLVDTVERSAESSYPRGYVSLSTWKGTLKKANKSLTIGEEAITSYYDKLSKVETPNDLVSKLVALMELQNLELILEDRYDGNKNLSLLDVSCKNEEVSNVCKQYGNCTVNDTALKGTIEGTYHVVTCFGYLQHLQYYSRKTLYGKVRDSLKDSGILVLSVPNLYADVAIKSSKGWQNYDIYSMSWTKESIVNELSENGFKVQYIVPVGQGLHAQAPDGAKNVPTSWTIGAIKG